MMWRLNWRRMIIACWLMTFTIALAGCATMQENLARSEKVSPMQAYAQERYVKALEYMEDSRFELAQGQFAVVAATAESPDLRNLGQVGYAKAGKAIALKR